MTYVEIDWEWVHSQLKKAGSKGTLVDGLVLDILHAIEDREYKKTQTDSIDKAITYAAKLYQGHPIVTDTDNDVWIDLRGGDISVRDIVRVRPDAYSGAYGTENNGRRGRVTAMRNGKITVLYDGDPVELARGHEISVLQKLDVK